MIDNVMIDCSHSLLRALLGYEPSDGVRAVQVGIGGGVLILAALFVASFWAGAQNALAGGGSFITLPALILTGMDARAANITSTVALFPAQLITGYTGRASAAGLPELSFKALSAISLAGGAIGGVILLATPPSFFAMLVPWLVLFATAVFAWGSFFRAPAAGAPTGEREGLRIAVVAVGALLTIGLFLHAP